MWLAELTSLVHGADRQHFRKVGAIESAQLRRHEVAQSDAILSMDTVFCQAILRQLWRQIMWLGELTTLVHGADRQHFRNVGTIASAQLRRRNCVGMKLPNLTQFWQWTLCFVSKIKAIVSIDHVAC